YDECFHSSVGNFPRNQPKVTRRFPGVDNPRQKFAKRSEAAEPGLGECEGGVKTRIHRIKRSDKAMKTLSKLLLFICVLGLVLGISDVGSPMFSGLARAIGAVFFILFFITRMLDFMGAAEP